ncbi:alkylglycerol monooxygenase [Caerostris extrusa]|uniref:Alkylglycerol monooxygenase n=1 Tax=Caerostris extrusa TaxID=172846 RepID=A0AAV4PTT8_CAEEX|nr:alkylglycerol monooxygenase [Caerostris extrusa]
MVAPLFFVTVLLEQVVRFYQKKDFWRISDTMSNTFHGFLMDLSKIPFKGAEVWVYAWIYKNYRLIDLPWDSPWTWIACWFITDFCYYWMHRMIHQVNILWAIHETHHTPEDMMFTSPMRNHIFLLPIHWITYMPMALAIPPTTYLVHYQISIIYQYWLHTEIIGKLPAPVEFLLSTPSHHRAHHAEDPDEKPLYGCTTQMKSYNPLVVQTQPFINLWKRFWEYEGIENKLSVIFKGPGWSPGKPWTGNIEDIPHPAPHFEKYDPQLPFWGKLYTFIHFVFLVNAYFMLALNMPAFIFYRNKEAFTCEGILSMPITLCELLSPPYHGGFSICGDSPCEKYPIAPQSGISLYEIISSAKGSIWGDLL